MDGPIKYNPENKDDITGVKLTKFGKEFSIVEVPYCFKLLLQELSSMNVQMRLITNENISEMNVRNSINYEAAMKGDKMIAMDINVGEDDEEVKIVPQDSFKDRMNKHVNIDPWVFDEMSDSYHSIIMNEMGEPTESISFDDERLEGQPPKFLPKGWNENDIIKYNISPYILTESLKINKIPNNWSILVDKIRSFNISNISINKPIDLNEYGSVEEKPFEVNGNNGQDEMIYAEKGMILNEPWIVKESKNNPGRHYFFNTQTKEMEWKMPYDIIKMESIYEKSENEQGVNGTDFEGNNQSEQQPTSAVSIESQPYKGESEGNDSEGYSAWKEKEDNEMLPQEETKGSDPPKGGGIESSENVQLENNDAPLIIKKIG